MNSRRTASRRTEYHRNSPKSDTRLKQVAGSSTSTLLPWWVCSLGLKADVVTYMYITPPTQTLPLSSVNGLQCHEYVDNEDLK